MTLTTETDLMIEVHKAILTLKEFQEVLLYQFTPIDRGAFRSPTACIYFEEEEIENRNRVDMVTGVLHIEIVWIADDARKNTEFWRTLIGLKARVQAAIVGRQEIRSLLSKLSRMPAQIFSVNDDELHLIQQYRLTFATAANDLTTQTI